MKFFTVIFGLWMCFFLTLAKANTVIAKPEQMEITFTLQANPTTGYSWYLEKYNAHLLQPISAVYHAPTSELIGAPGFMVWKFRLLAGAHKVPQMTKITLRYLRAFEEKQGDATEVRVIILGKT